MLTETKAGDILPAHRFDEARLSKYLAERIPGLAGPIAYRQFQGGQSNPTYLATAADGARFVIRKKPPGKLLPSAHLIEREHQALDALFKIGLPVPRPLLLCEDASVIGTAFYVMSFVAGRVFPNPAMPGVSPAERTEAYASMAATLARIHAVDWRRCGLATFGRPEGYVARQVDRWSKQYTATKTSELPDMDLLSAWLASNLPQEEEDAIAHGDYRLGNLIFAPEGGAVIAVVDWELATIGHPLADLAYACMAYRLPPESTVFQGLAGLDLAKLGIPNEAAFVAAYRRQSGRAEIPHWRFFLAFAFFRICAITQGVYARAIQGNASDAAARNYSEIAKLTAKVGWSIASGAPEPSVSA
jgi:aminoglycoside phosphotransferase (APT) family kinase protein